MMNITRRYFVKAIGAAGTALASLKALGAGEERLLPSVAYQGEEGSNATGYLRLRVSAGKDMGPASHVFVGLLPNDDLTYDLVYSLPLFVKVDEGRMVVDAADFSLTAAGFSFQLFDFHAIADMRSHEHLSLLSQALRLPPLYHLPVPKLSYLPLNIARGDTVTILWAAQGLMTVG